MENERLDIIIFGATGFTGKHVVEKAASLAKEKQFKFGVAGRRKEALEAVVKTYAPDIENIPIIIADIKDEESLKKMAEQAKVIANCCGPYRFYGEAVVKACIAARTHHVDVSGEPQYMEQIQLKYNKEAKDAGVYIVSACGFDSIPCDLGVIFTQNKFQGQINSIEAYLTLSTSTKASGPVIAYGTWESLIYGAAHMNELHGLRRALFPEKLPPLLPKLKRRSLIHRSSIIDGWSTRFLGADRSVVYRTQRFLYEKYKQRPIQIETYFTVKSFWQMLILGLVGLILFVMTKTSYGRNLLLKYPSLFSFGFVNREGPKEEVIKNTHFTIVFKAEGWTEKLSEPTDQYPDPPNQSMITKVTGVNPAYGITCVALILSALTIINEADKIPDNGGVFTPGAAFNKTSMIEELIKHDLKFEVVSSIEK